MEQTNKKLETGQMSLENLKRTTFNEVMKSVLFRFKEETDHRHSFTLDGGREISITTTAGAVRALGQISSQMSYDVYNEVITHKNKYVRNRI